MREGEMVDSGAGRFVVSLEVERIRVVVSEAPDHEVEAKQKIVDFLTAGRNLEYVAELEELVEVEVDAGRTFADLSAAG
jgi:hypothetical protein